LQGIRLVEPTLGETVVVTGLGLIGLIVVQLLRANGCRVLGIDYDPIRLQLAREFGAEVVDLSAGVDPVAAADRFSRGHGVDSVIITAATSSSEPMHQAATMCRKRGRIVLVGVTGLELSRADFYEKELSFQVSCSYGPGRYDPNYEDKGIDYPIGYVRWTEQRNFEAVLDLMASGALDMAPLISHRFAIDDAAAAYEAITGDDPSLGVLLEYEHDAEAGRERTIEMPAAASTAPAPTAGTRVSFLGAGNYASAVLIPAFAAAGADLRSVMSMGGVSGTHAAKKFGFAASTTDAERVIADPDSDAVVICTRHDSHADLACRALAAGKHVFVEKPLALTGDEVDAVAAQLRDSREGGAAPLLMVGFNRRFAPHVVKLKQLLDIAAAPATMIMTVNAGAIPAAHWTQDPTVGGGRIVGEACHFVDLLRFLAGARIDRHSAIRTATDTGETATLSLGFANGWTGTIHYLANGDKSFPKERLEVFCNGGILQLDNFRVLRGFGWPGFRKMKLMKQDKGQRACARAFLDAIRGRTDSPIDAEELLETSRVTIALAEA
ncbi:MAG: bi-domain-containing oxidoreductase, partial [Gammaproteobacteria bacterium]